MDKRRITRIALLISGLIVLAFLISFGLSLFTGDTPAVTLPTMDVSAKPNPNGNGIGSGGKQGDGAGVPINVTTETVQRIIETMDRLESYYRTVATETFWGDGNSGVTMTKTWVDGAFTKTETVLPNGEIQYAIIGEGQLYIWYGDHPDYYVGPADDLSADLLQRIPTYETILELDPRTITDADYVERNGTACIYVEVAENQLGYLERYWVDVHTGLLIEAVTVKKDVMIYRMLANEPETPISDSAAFVLPDGIVLYNTQ